MNPSKFYKITRRPRHLRPRAIDSKYIKEKTGKLKKEKAEKNEFKTKLIKTKQKCPRCKSKMKARKTTFGQTLHCLRCGYSNK